MGSTGSGSFTDYPGSGSKRGGGGSGGSSGTDRCNKAFSCELEEIEQCDYFSKHSSAPPADTLLSLAHNKRIMAVDESGITVGALPTELNYLAGCLKEGFNYQGRVVSSTSGSVATVTVDFKPTFS